jgi:guanosine-3',5'-bis(diphosphate) 3'-pyrophosphohydrolase
MTAGLYRTFRTEELGLIMRALEFAAHKHRDQRRIDVHASPYINHPIALANILINEAQVYDAQVICSALLHDTIEDTQTSPEELQQAFGERIRDIVLEVTDDQALSKQERKRLQIEHAAGASLEAKLVKLADKIANLRDIAVSPPPKWSLHRQQEYFDWARQVIDGLRGAHPALEAAFDEAYARRPG